jgi:hypothetical protein
VVDSLDAGGRLDRPDACPLELYQVMLRCWDAEEAKRPSFKEVIFSPLE